MSKPKVKPCPKCEKRDSVVRILYGWVRKLETDADDWLFKSPQQRTGEDDKDDWGDDFVSAGCAMGGVDPRYLCRNCLIAFAFERPELASLDEVRRGWIDESPAIDMESDCIHVSPNDNPFTARMRFHQSWYRRYVLGLPPGPNPSAKGDALYGSQISEAAGLAGRNFITDSIYAAVEGRIADGHGLVEPKRVRCNLLSSQPMCFNLWAPLADDLQLATRFVRALPGLPEDLTVTRIILEYAPDRESHLDDATAFDAFVDYKLPDGARGFVGVETKLTEPFSRKAYEFRRGYSRWMDAEDWWWQEGAEEQFPNRQINQLWRNHLLAFAMLHQEPAEYAEGSCAVLYHDGDKACTEAITTYRGHLRYEADRTLLSWPLSDYLAAGLEAVRTPDETGWLVTLGRRYVDMSASDAAWAAFS